MIKKSDTSRNRTHDHLVIKFQPIRYLNLKKQFGDNSLMFKMNSTTSIMRKEVFTGTQMNTIKYIFFREPPVSIPVK